MIGKLKLVSNFEQVAEYENKVKDAKELGFEEIIPEVKKQYKYVTSGFHLNDVKRWYMTADGKDVTLIFSDDIYTFKAEQDLICKLESMYK